MYEDDRIRHKNRKNQEAWDLVEGLRAMGYDNAYIIKYANFALSTCTDSFRNEVYLTVKNIVGSLDEKVDT